MDLKHTQAAMDRLRKPNNNHKNKQLIEQWLNFSIQWTFSKRDVLSSHQELLSIERATIIDIFFLKKMNIDSIFVQRSKTQLTDKVFKIKTIYNAQHYQHHFDTYYWIFLLIKILIMSWIQNKTNNQIFVSNGFISIIFILVTFIKICAHFHNQLKKKSKAKLTQSNI